MIFKNVKNINIPEGVVVKIATALDGIILWQKEIEMPTDEIWYTSTDGNIVKPFSTGTTTILSNTYEDGIGKLKLEGDLSNFLFSFYNCKTLKTIILPESIVTIHPNIKVFQNCSNLEEVTLPDSLTTLGNYTFDSCTSLKSIVIPKNVISLGGEHTFQKCSNLESVIIEGLTINGVGYSAFSDCKKLSSIDTSKVVKSYASYGFQRCNPNVLPQMVINENVSGIGYQVFPYNVNIISNNNRFIIENDLLIDLQNNKIIQGLKDINNYVYNIPNYITTVGGEAFYSCSSLKSIVLPEGVTTIDNQAFYSAYNLTTVDFPSTLLSIDYKGFDGTSKLNTIISRAKTAPSLYRSNSIGWICFKDAGKNVAEGEKFIYIYKDADYESYTTGEWKTQLIDTGWQIRFIEGDEPEPEEPDTPEEPEIVIPTGNTILYTTTDDSIMELNSAYNPVVLSHTYENGLGTLESSTEHNNINDNIFTDTTKLKTIIIGDGFDTIIGLAECINLEEVIMGDSVKTIEDMAFRDDSKLNKVVLSNEITEIPSECFSKCSSLTNIVIPEKVTTIDSSAFNKTGLEEVIIPDSVTLLSSSAFWLCENLKSIVIGSGVTSLEENGNYFFRCYYLGSITVKAEVAPALNGSTFSCGSKVEGDKILYIYEGATGYEAWLEKLPGFKIEYITE